MKGWGRWGGVDPLPPGARGSRGHLEGPPDPPLKGWKAWSEGRGRAERALRASAPPRQRVSRRAGVERTEKDLSRRSLRTASSGEEQRQAPLR